VRAFIAAVRAAGLVAIAQTLDTYSHLFPDSGDVPARLAKAASSFFSSKESPQ